jgi:hypothetical protein
VITSVIWCLVIVGIAAPLAVRRYKARTLD